MGEKRTAIYPVKVDYLCDKCNQDFMRPEGTILMSNPPQWSHMCSCGNQQTFYQKYPYIEWVNAEKNAAKEVV